MNDQTTNDMTEAQDPRGSGLGGLPCSTFVLLACWYEGDSNLVQDSFIACGEIESLKRCVPDGAELFMPGEVVPDDGQYGDQRRRFRIVHAPILSNAESEARREGRRPRLET